jgi:NAD(P)-dependent dehydrogenase (short-subunit alcohol dehydrogenase family)
MKKSLELSRRSLLMGSAAVFAGFASTRALFAAEAGAAGAAKADDSLKGRIALVTGSTDGLGKAVALKLANAGAHVIVHGRNVERGNAVTKEINDLGRGGAMFYQADFSSLTEVRAFAAAVKRDHKNIHVLINNAGIGSANADGSKDRQLSKDGYEQRFAVNYLSGYLLTRELLPTLIASAPARIVNVASLAQTAIDFDNVMLERDYNGGRAYGQSKLAQIMFTEDLAQELAGKKITVNSLHPSTYMNTTMVLSAGVQPRSTVETGADAVMFLAASPELEGKSGLFFNVKQEMKANPQAYDVDARAKLKGLSEKLVAKA